MPPVARVRARGAALELNIRAVGFTDTVRALRDARRNVARQVDEFAREAGEKEVLPEAKRRAGSLKVAGTPVASTLVVRKRRTAPYLTTTMRGIRGRAVGLLEFGGTVRTEIRPKRKQALSFGGRHPVARVSTVREYREQRFLQDAVKDRIDDYGNTLRDLIVERVFSKDFEIE